MRTLLLSLLLLVAAASLRAEYFTISHFHADLTLRPDGVLEVKETIRVRFSEPRHGIFRTIPYVYRTADEAKGVLQNRPSMSSFYRIWIGKVQVQGFEFEKNTDGSLMFLKVGSEDIMVQGEQTYVISYEIINGLDEFPDHLELYYNITGVDWQTTIDTASATIRLPGGHTPAAADLRIYQGPFGSQEPGIGEVADGALHIGSTRRLEPQEGLTFAVRMPQGLASTTLPLWIRLSRWWWIILPVLLGMVLLVIWLRLGRQYKFVKQVHFYPPDGITPAEAGLLTDHMVNNRDIISMIFHWAQEGHITISEGPHGSNDYVLHSKGNPQTLWGYEYGLYSAIFPDLNRPSSVNVKSLKYKLAPAIQKCRMALNTHAQEEAFYVKGTRLLRVLLMVLGAAMLLGAFVTLLMAAIPSFFVLSGRLDIPVSLLASGLLVLLWGRKMVRWGPGGRKHIAQLWGFREFIQRAEADRIRELVDANPGYFGQTLPYAIAFGLAEEWAAKFRDLTIPLPSWYQGNAVDMLAFTRTIHHATTSIQSNFTATQSSSSGGGGFSGGSGGGIGGGGGGSW